MLKYCVSISADLACETGWEEVARFKHQGNAWAHAVAMRDSLGRFSRVTDIRGKQIARFDPVEPCDTEPASA